MPYRLTKITHCIIGYLEIQNSGPPTLHQLSSTAGEDFDAVLPTRAVNDEVLPPI